MKVLKQGEEYEEDTTEENLEDEGDEDTSAGISKIAGIPIKFIVIGGAILLVLVLFVVVFGSRGESNNTVVPAEQEGYQQSQQQQQQQPAVRYYAWTAPDGTYLCTTAGMAEGTVINNGSEDTGILTSSGTTLVTASTGETAMANVTLKVQAPVQNDTPLVGYGTEQVETLKRLGYTGDEIELAISMGMDFDVLVATAQELRDAEAMEAIKRMSDQASDEFKYLLDHGIYGFEYRDFTPKGDDLYGYNQQGSYLVNADYEKLDTYGYQLYIKVKIANNTFAYMEISPNRWETLPETGNIVVRVNYVRYGTADENDVYITSILEQDITQITVNPQDTTVDFSDMTAAR